jgi:REP element-mobilizing transposase RayT
LGRRFASLTFENTRVLLPLFKMLRRRPSRRKKKAPSARPGEQLELRFRNGWGGRRDGAGRKRLARRKSVPHRTRAEQKKRHPVHVTLRARRQLPSLREQVLFLAVRRAIAKASREWFRVLHFSVQRDHVHLMVEARDKVSLGRGTAGLAIRAARELNRILNKRGAIWGDRYHARALNTPREVRRGLVYVLMNWKKHTPSACGFDACSSAWWFDGWTKPPSSRPPGWREIGAPVAAPREWLSTTGWKLHGLVAPNEQPKDTNG